MTGRKANVAARWLRPHGEPASAALRSAGERSAPTNLAKRQLPRACAADAVHLATLFRRAAARAWAFIGLEATAAGVAAGIGVNVCLSQASRMTDMREPL